jgi:protease-4
MPGQTLFAERTTLTGSIGVYSSFPNIKELGQKIGVSLNTIKQGQIKDSGSPFKDMTAHEREVWQDTVDEAYQAFLQIVEQGRPMLANGKLLQPLQITPVRTGPDFLQNGAERKPYERYLADGGVWTAGKALQFQLIDKIGSLDDAIQAAHDAARLDEDYQVIKYERPSTLAELLGLGVLSPVAPSGSLLDPARLEGGFLPRLWYLAPGAETSGFLAATRNREGPP